MAGPCFCLFRSNHWPQCLKYPSDYFSVGPSSLARLTSCLIFPTDLGVASHFCDCNWSSLISIISLRGGISENLVVSGLYRYQSVKPWLPHDDVVDRRCINNHKVDQQIVRQSKNGEGNIPYSLSCDDPSNPTKTDWVFIKSLVVNSMLIRLERNITQVPAPRSIKILFTSKLPTCSVTNQASWSSISILFKSTSKKDILSSACNPCEANLGSWDSMSISYKCSSCLMHSHIWLRDS